MKNKFLLTGIITFTIMSGIVFATPDNNLSQQTSQKTPAPAVSDGAKSSTINTSAESKTEVLDSSSAPKSIPEKNMDRLKDIGKNGSKNGFLRFFIAMSGVAISSLAIYGGLKLYKKISLQKNMFVSNPNDERSLETPKDFKSAINLFLNKTDI